MCVCPWKDWKQCLSQKGLSKFEGIMEENGLLLCCDVFCSFSFQYSVMLLGWGDIAVWAEITEADLKEMGFAKGFVRRFFMLVKEMKENGIL